MLSNWKFNSIIQTFKTRCGALKDHAFSGTTQRHLKRLCCCSDPVKLMKCDWVQLHPMAMGVWPHLLHPLGHHMSEREENVGIVSSGISVKYVQCRAKSSLNTVNKESIHWLATLHCNVDTRQCHWLGQCARSRGMFELCYCHFTPLWLISLSSTRLLAIYQANNFYLKYWIPMCRAASILWKQLDVFLFETGFIKNHFIQSMNPPMHIVKHFHRSSHQKKREKTKQKETLPARSMAPHTFQAVLMTTHRQIAD